MAEEMEISITGAPNMVSPPSQMPAATSESRLTAETRIEDIIEKLRSALITIECFQTSNQQVLWNKINEIVDGFNDVERLRSTFEDVQVPVDVFRYIDEGKNPDLHAKEMIESCKARNEQTNGKIATFQFFKDTLEAEIQKNFAAEYAEFIRLKQQPQPPPPADL